GPDVGITDSRRGDPSAARARLQAATSAASSKPAGPTARVRVVGFERWCQATTASPLARQRPDTTMSQRRALFMNAPLSLVSQGPAERCPRFGDQTKTTCSHDQSRTSHAGTPWTFRSLAPGWFRFGAPAQTRHRRKVAFSSGKSLKVLN